MMGPAGDAQGDEPGSKSKKKKEKKKKKKKFLSSEEEERVKTQYVFVLRILLKEHT